MFGSVRYKTAVLFYLLRDWFFRISIGLDFKKTENKKSFHPPLVLQITKTQKEVI